MQIADESDHSLGQQIPVHIHQVLSGFRITASRPPFLIQIQHLDWHPPRRDIDFLGHHDNQAVGHVGPQSLSDRWTLVRDSSGCSSK